MAERIQKELARRLPGDPVIQEFSKYLPVEALAQRKAMNGQGEEEGDEDYYDEEDEGGAAATTGKDAAEEEKEEDYGKEDEEEENAEKIEEGAETKPDEEAQPMEEKKKGEGEQSEYEDEDDGYGEEDYDAEGKYKWGNEGSDWDWYYREDKEAYERGDLMPNTLNPPVMIDKAQIERAVAAHKENQHGNQGGIYRTNVRKRPAG